MNAATDPGKGSAMVSFDDTFRHQLHELFVWRRDVRRFRTDPLPDRTIERLIEILPVAFGRPQPALALRHGR